MDFMGLKAIKFKQNPECWNEFSHIRLLLCSWVIYPNFSIHFNNWIIWALKHPLQTSNTKDQFRERNKKIWNPKQAGLK